MGLGVLAMRHYNLGRGIGNENFHGRSEILTFRVFTAGLLGWHKTVLPA
jgi:hypothetical protein